MLIYDKCFHWDNLDKHWNKKKPQMTINIKTSININVSKPCNKY